MKNSVTWIKNNTLIFPSIAVIFLFMYATTNFILNNSYFWLDDLFRIQEANTLPFPNLLIKNIDVHIVPLVNGINYLLYLIAPVNFGFNLSVLIFFHVLTLIYLYKLLQEIRPHTFNIVFIVFYNCNLFMLTSMSWLASGMHRLPYIFFSVAAMYYYLRYKKTGKTMPLMLVIICFLCSFGFYEKAILIPIYLLSFELCLSSSSSRPELFSRLKVGLSLLIVSFAYLAWYYLCAPVFRIEQHADNWLAMYILKINFKVFLSGLLTSTNENLYGISLIGILGVFIFYRNKFSRHSYFIAVNLIGVIALNFILLAAQPRQQSFADFAGHALRYYYEVFFLLIIFLKLLITSLSSPQKNIVQSKSTINAWGVLSVCILYAVSSYFVSTNYYKKTETDNLIATNRYMTNLFHDISLVGKNKIIVLPDVDFPRYITTIFYPPLKMSAILPLRYKNVQFISPEQSPYIIKDNGHLAKREE